MKNSRYLTAGIALVALCALAIGGTSLAESAGSTPAKRCITVLYPNTPGVKFDFEYYRTHHIPLIKRLYGKGIAKFELRRGVETPDKSPVPYIATINIWIGSQQAFDDAQAKHAQELIADVPNFTNAKPVIQTDEIVN
jgi:uncharacterized protein (TIGR02118 family)